MNAAIDCTRVSEQHFADRYAMGQLDPDESEAFEDHFMTCEACVTDLEQAELRVRGFKRFGAEAAGLAQSLPAAVMGPAAEDPVPMSMDDPAQVESSIPWSRQPVVWMSMAAVLLAVLALPNLMPRGEAGAGSIQIFHLQPERSSEGQAGHRVQLPSKPGPIVLALELDPPLFDSYRATLKRQHQELWQGTDLTLGERDTLNLSLDTRLLAAGDHLLFLEGYQSGQWVEVTRFPFHVLNAP